MISKQNWTFCGARLFHIVLTFMNIHWSSFVKDKTYINKHHAQDLVIANARLLIKYGFGWCLTRTTTGSWYRQRRIPRKNNYLLYFFRFKMFKAKILVLGPCEVRQRINLVVYIACINYFFICWCYGTFWHNWNTFSRTL